jgi:hypothetical protein
MSTDTIVTWWIKNRMLASVVQSYVLFMEPRLYQPGLFWSVYVEEEIIYLHQMQDLDYEFSCLIVMLVHAWLTILSVLNLGKKDVRFVGTQHIVNEVVGIS